MRQGLKAVAGAICIVLTNSLAGFAQQGLGPSTSLPPAMDETPPAAGTAPSHGEQEGSSETHENKQKSATQESSSLKHAGER